MVLPKPSGEFHWVQESWGTALRCGPLGEVAPHCFSTRELRLEGVRDAEHSGWDAIARSLGVAGSALVKMRQVHGARVFEAGNDALPKHYEEWPEADVAITGNSSYVISVRVADCVPVLLADSRTRAVAAVHAGWRGTAAGAVIAALRALDARYGSQPPDIYAAVGPSIGPCCYEVGHDLPAHFAAHPEAARWFLPGVKPRLDLWRATRDQLERAGVPTGQIHVSELCTFDYPDLFHSFRRDGKHAGRLVAAIRSAPDTRP